MKSSIKYGLVLFSVLMAVSFGVAYAEIQIASNETNKTMVNATNMTNVTMLKNMTNITMPNNATNKTVLKVKSVEAVSKNATNMTNTTMPNNMTNVTLPNNTTSTVIPMNNSSKPSN
jgi:uncharacterized protein YaaW (UPF0174 family)